MLNSLQNGIPYDVFKISGFYRKYIEKCISQQYIFLKISISESAKNLCICPYIMMCGK